MGTSPRTIPCVLVFPALEVPRFPEPAHLISHRCDDVVEMRLFIRLKSFLRQFQAVILASRADERRSYLGQKLAKEFVEYAAEEGIDSALQMNKQCGSVGKPIEQPNTSVGRGKP